MTQLWLHPLGPDAAQPPGAALFACPADGDLAAVLALAGPCALVTGPQGGPQGGRVLLRDHDGPGALQLRVVRDLPLPLPEMVIRLGHGLPELPRIRGRDLPWSIEDWPDGDPVAALGMLALALHDRRIPPATHGASVPWPDCAAPNVALPWISGRDQRSAALRMPDGIWLLLAESNPAEERMPLATQRAAELVVLSAPDKPGLLAAIAALAARCEGSTLPDIARAQAGKQVGIAASAERLAIVATSTAELRQRLQKAAALVMPAAGLFGHPMGIWYGPATETPQPVALIFPGQGAQYPGMLAASILGLPGLRAWFDLLDQTYPDSLPFLPSRLMLRQWPEGSDEATAFQGLAGGGFATLIFSLAMTAFLGTFGLRPAAMIGHSNGENAALIASGVLRSKTRRGIFSVLAHMSLLFSQADRTGRQVSGVCYALVLPPDMGEAALEALMESDCHLMMDNCPHQKLVWVQADRVGAVIDRMRAAGIIAMQLPITVPYHTPLFAPVVDSFIGDYQALDLGSGTVPLYSGLIGQPFPADKQGIIRTATGQWSAPVRFQSAIKQMHDDGMRVFIDMGPGGRMAGFVRDALRDRAHVALAVDEEARADGSAPLRVLAMLFVSGAISDLTALYPTVAVPVAPDPVAVPVVDTRARIALAHMKLMQTFLGQETRMFAEIAGRLQQTRAPAPAAMRPLDVYGLVSAEVTAEGFRALLHLDPARQVFLQDHVFGRRRGAGSALAVLPFFMSLEIAAAAACQWAGPGWVVTGIEAAQGHRWIAADAGAIDLTVAVRVLDGAAPGEHRFATRLTQGTDARPDFDCVVLLSRSYPAAPAPAVLTAPPPPALRSDGSPAPTAAEFAAKLFHGPSFQALREIVALGPEGIEVVLAAPPEDRLFPEALSVYPPHVVPGPLLDSAGQILAFQEKSIYNRIFGLFPHAVARVSFYAPPPLPGAKLRAVALTQRTREDMTGSVDYIDAGGGLVARIDGLKMVFIDWSRRWERAFFPGQPPDPLGKVIHRDARVTVVLVPDFQPGFLEVRHRIWLRVLASCTLSAPEAQAFAALPASGPRAREWLLGRIAAKEATLAAAGRDDIDIGDLTVSPAASGAPRVLIGGTLVSGSISHSGAFAAGAVAGPGWQIGIDIEPRAAGAVRLLEASMAFGVHEAAAVRRHGHAAIWCAKEAVAKAIGTGLMGAPLRFQVSLTGGDPALLSVSVAGDEVEVRLIAHPDCYAAVCILSTAQAQALAQHLGREILLINGDYHAVD